MKTYKWPESINTQKMNKAINKVHDRVAYEYKTALESKGKNDIETQIKLAQFNAILEVHLEILRIAQEEGE